MSDNPETPIETDVAIVGAGPAGLFAVFELGLLDLKAHLIDILDRPGGQCTELYPEKPIYDIPGLPIVTGQELTGRLMEQIKPFGATFHFGEMANALKKLADGRWKLSTDVGTEIIAPVIVIAAGGGSFMPKRPPVPGIEAYEGTSVHYAVRKMETFRGKNVLIAGGGDSALDWTLNLAPIAKSLTLVHHRDGFRAAQHSVNRMRELVEQKKINFHVASVKALHGEGGQLSRRDAFGSRQTRMASGGRGASSLLRTDDEAGTDRGFRHQSARKPDPRGHGALRKPDAGHFRHRRHHQLSGQAEADLSGFHEAALMAQAAFHICRPNEKLRFQYTTSSSSLQKKLGVA